MYRRGDPLTDKILEEIRSALSLVYRTIDQHSVDLHIGDSFVVFDLAVRCPVVSRPFQAAPPAVVNLLQRVAPGFPQFYTVNLFRHGVPINYVQCKWQPVLSHEPVFSGTPLPHHLVTFNNIRTPQVKGWLVSPFGKDIQTSWIEPRKISARIRNLPVSYIQTKQKGFPLSSLKGKVLPVPPRLFTLPITKGAVPLHRFDSRKKERFRKALADKAETRVTNVQIQVVFDRMTMSVYNSIAQDKRGNMLCIPKAELIGKNRNPLKVQSAEEAPPVYLVMGSRVDNQESIRALVPSHDEDEEA